MHSVCPTLKKQKIPQPRRNLQRRSNPAVKLLMPLVHIHIIGSAKEEVPGVSAINDVPADVTNISTTEETILLESAEEDKDKDDDDFQERLPRKAARRSYDSRRKFQLIWVARCSWTEAWTFLV